MLLIKMDMCREGFTLKKEEKKKEGIYRALVSRKCGYTLFSRVPRCTDTVIITKLNYSQFKRVAFRSTVRAPELLFVCVTVDRLVGCRFSSVMAVYWKALLHF